MPLSPFHAYTKACELSRYRHGMDRLLPAFASSDMEVYPFQVAAAMFALRSPYLKGAVLCDEGSLGKTNEALLILAQLWFEGKERILLVVPTPLVQQWVEIMDGHFSLPYEVVDSRQTWDACVSDGQTNPFLQEGIVLTTYEFAAEQAEAIGAIRWDICVFEEAHRLATEYTGDNRTATALKAAVGDAYKLLLTATPMRNSIMDLFGLIHFIDDAVFPDEKTFYARYFRKPENYHELATRASRYCFRTLRSQVEGYVNIPARLPVTVRYTPAEPEQRLYQMLMGYLALPEKMAFPKMDQYDLTLMLTRALSSSTFALERVLQGILSRLSAMPASEELSQIQTMHALAASIRTNAKADALLKALAIGFAELKKRGARDKALIFTENRATQQFLHSLLQKAGYKTITYNGSNSRDYSIIKAFEQDAQILIATDVAAEGFNLAFCSFVINYDLPYNTLTLEQRIMRCHRQGQKSDVLALSFLNPDNFADVRTLELINKRVLQFGGIFGMSDDVVGGFDDNVERTLRTAFATARNRETIARDYQTTLADHEAENAALVAQAEQALFTTFTDEVSRRVAVTPQYVKDKTKAMNDDLWAVTRWFFEGKQGYECIDKTRTVRIGIQPQKVFTGGHLGRREYSMDDTSLPRSGRHTLTGVLTKNILSEMYWRCVPDQGAIAVVGLEKSAKIGYYHVEVKPEGALFGELRYDAFVGQTEDGQVLSDAECRGIMTLPVLEYRTAGNPIGQKDGAYAKPPDALDALIDPPAFLRRAAGEMNPVLQEEMDATRARFADRKHALSREVEHLRGELRQMEVTLARAGAISEKVQAEKQKATVQRTLKAREQALFMDGLRLDAELEEQLQRMTEQTKLTVAVRRQFAIQVGGKEHVR